jgi:hypothetical protein
MQKYQTFIRNPDKLKKIDVKNQIKEKFSVSKQSILRLIGRIMNLVLEFLE